MGRLWNEVTEYFRAGGISDEDAFWMNIVMFIGVLHEGGGLIGDGCFNHLSTKSEKFECICCMETHCSLYITGHKWSMHVHY